MVSDSIKSMKEDYISEKDLTAKTSQWIKELKGYIRKKVRFKFIPSSSALLVMDMQRFFLDEKSHAYIHSSKAIIPNIRMLLNEYRKLGLPVIFTRHSLEENEDPGIMGKWWGDVIRKGNPLSEIIPSLCPLTSEIIIRKNRYDAFHGTELGNMLKDMKVKSVVITGVMTHLCCETTAREAFMRDYEVFFVIDGTATQNEELHISSLKTLSHGFAEPVTTSELINELRRTKH